MSEAQATKDTKETKKTEPKPLSRAEQLARERPAVAKAIKALAEDEELDLSPRAAVFFAAWCLKNGNPFPGDAVEHAKMIRRTNAVAFTSVTRADYIGFARACEFSGLKRVEPAVLQTACTELSILLPSLAPDGRVPKEPRA